MTRSALIMLLLTWGLISGLTAWLFWRLWSTPQRHDSDTATRDEISVSPQRDDP